MTQVHEYHPAADELGYTFGGRAPVRKIRPGDVLRVSTQDCFGGVVRGVDDLPSRVCQFPYLNPVSGPFHVEGAEPGDTLAVHFVSITPARDWAVSATFPHFGALTSTHTTATLQPPLEERVWLYDVDVPARIVRWHARRSDHTIELPLDPMHGTVGVAPGGVRSPVQPHLRRPRRQPRHPRDPGRGDALPRGQCGRCPARPRRRSCPPGRG